MAIIEDFSFFSVSFFKKVRQLLRSGTPVDRICDHDMLMVRKQEMGLCVFAVSATNHRPLGTTISQLPPPPPRQQHICVLASVPSGSQHVPSLYINVFRSFRTSL